MQTLKDNEQALLKAMASGDTEAFETVYLAHKDDLLTVLVWMFKDRPMAEDVLHDVFVSLARRAGELKLRGKLRNYLVTSCINRARDLVRRRVRDQSLAGADVRNQTSTPDDPADVAIAQEQRGQVASALKALPHVQREVVALHIHGKLTFREIAELLRISINTVQSRYRYALTSLRTTFPGENGAER